MDLARESIVTKMSVADR